MLNIVSAGMLGSVSTTAFVLSLIGAIIVGVVAGIFIFKIIKSKNLDKSKADASKILEDAYQEAKTILKEAKLSAQEESLKLKTEIDNELNLRRNEIEKLNERYLQREEFINNKEQTLEKKSEHLDQMKEKLVEKENELEHKKEELDEKNKQVVAQLEKVSSMTKEQAKNELVRAIEEDAKHEAALMVNKIEQEAKDTANKKATNIISLAIQRYSADITSEGTASTVALPSDDMKGRLIGREGRNIRALEQATGIDLIIDDTPEAIVLSGFDPIRREIARVSIEKLMQDGRIHPARIEETVAKVKRDIEQDIKETGEQALLDSGVHGLNTELVKLLGRMKYRTSYGQNMLKHSLEVSYIAGMMADELGVDGTVARRGGLLHDIGKAVDFEVEGSHVAIGVDLAKKYKENEKVINCIEAHHGDVEFSCVEAVLVQAADVISSSRPGARRESLENYIKRLQKLEEISNSFKGVEKSFAIQAGREIRIMVQPEEIDDAQALFLAKEIAKRIENEMEYPGQIKVNVIRETRSIEYAK